MWAGRSKYDSKLPQEKTQKQSLKTLINIYNVVSRKSSFGYIKIKSAPSCPVVLFRDIVNCIQRIYFISGQEGRRDAPVQEVWSKKCMFTMESEEKIVE